MLVRMALPSEKIERDKLTYEAWGLPLDRASYLVREERLRSHPWARTAMTTFLLCDDDGSVLSSCEAFRMVSISRRGGDYRQSPVYAIASVFTESRHRGRGYASRLLQGLHSHLEGSDSATQAFILYSEVGAAIYERVGYTACPGMDWILEAKPPVPTECALVGADDPLVIPPPPRVPFVIWPTPEQLNWHRERERIYAEHLNLKRPHASGARLGESVIYWSADLRRSELMVLLFSARTATDAEALLRTAQSVAFATNLKRLIAWAPQENPVFNSLVSKLGITARRRTSSIAMIRPAASDITPTHWAIIERGMWV